MRNLGNLKTKTKHKTSKERINARLNTVKGGVN